MNRDLERTTSGVQTISVIIPSLNSPVIDRVIDAMRGQDMASVIDEVIVVGKDDAGLIPEAPGVRLIDTGRPVDASTARNLGIEATTGDLLIFLDSDCIPRPEWLKWHIAAHEAGHPVVGGGVLPAGAGYWHLTYNLSMFHEVFSTAPARSRPFLPTLNLSVERRVIDIVGGLDERLKYSHDLDWTTRMRRAGFVPWFCPRAAVEHVHSRHTLRQVWDDCAINGYYARQVRVEYGVEMGTPALFRYPWLVRLLSPFIALGVTARIVSTRPATMLEHISTIPAVFLTKVAWCWGAGSEAGA